jgi:myosin-crossreactive antigen
VRGMRRFLSRFVSRKFLLAVGTALTLIANQQYDEAVAVVLAYLAAEGYIDAKAAS